MPSYADAMAAEMNRSVDPSEFDAAIDAAIAKTKRSTAEDSTLTLWVIDRDYLAEGDEPSRVGYGQTLDKAQATVDSFNAYVGRAHYMSTGLTTGAIPAEHRVRFRLMDEDEEVHYGGACDARILTGVIEGEDGEDFGYNIDRFGMDDSGAVIGVYKTADLIAAGATSKRPGHEGEAIGVEAPACYGGAEWRMIYG